jgi:hypothetical protein
MKSGSLAIAGLAVGVVGVLIALAIRTRWARPVGAVLLALAVMAEVAAVQAGPSSRAGTGGRSSPASFPTGLATTGTPLAPTTIKPVTIPPPRPQLLSQIHPGVLAITKLIVVNKEFVRLTNNGTAPAPLAGWVLSNGTFTYTFPVGTVIPPHESLLVRSGPGINSTTTIHLNLTHYIWPKVTGTATLKDAHGVVVQTCHYLRDVAHQDPSATC